MIGLSTLPTLPTLLSLVALAPSFLSPLEPSAINYVDQVSPILAQHCTECHRVGGSAPFALDSYSRVRPWARAIVRKTEERTMPPWLPNNAGLFVGERGLDQDDIGTLRDWVEGGAVRGVGKGAESATPTVSKNPRSWRLGEPDLVLTLDQAFAVPAGSRDLFRNFVFEVPSLESLRKSNRRLGATGSAGATLPWVRAIEIDPDDARVLHHAVLSLDRTGASRQLDGDDGQPGFSGMDATPLESPGGQFIGWTPGKEPTPGDERFAWLLEPGTSLVLQTHLAGERHATSLAPRLGVYWSTRPPDRSIQTLRLGSSTIEILPQAEGYRVQEKLVLPVEVDLLSVYPHAHYLASTVRASALLPGGREIDLLTIERWDFSWQDQYRYRQPIRLPRGTEIEMSIVYANVNTTALAVAAEERDSVREPSDELESVFFGPSSSDEMADLWLEVTPLELRDAPALRAFSARRRLERQVDFHLWRLERFPERDPSYDQLGLATAWSQLGRADPARALLQELVERKPQLARARTNLGNLLLDAGEVEEAMEHLRRAVTLEPGSAQAWFNLGSALLRVDRNQQAIAALEQCSELDPADPKAHLNRGIAYSRLGRPDEEVAAYRKALGIQGVYAPAYYNLGRALEREGRLPAAIDAYRKAAEITPDLLETQGALADALYQTGRLAEAEPIYRRLVALDPELTAAWRRLADVLLALGRTSESSAALQGLGEIEPPER